MWKSILSLRNRKSTLQCIDDIFFAPSPDLAGTSSTEVPGWAGGSRWQPRPLDFRKPLLCRMFLKGIPSWKAIQPRWHPPSTVVEGKAVPLQGSACSSLPPFRSLLLASCSISSQQWYQRVAKGNPRTAKPILDINSLPRLRWYFGLLCMVFAIVYFQLMRSTGILPWKVWYLSHLLFTSDNSYENRLIIHRKS